MNKAIPVAIIVFAGVSGCVPSKFDLPDVVRASQNVENGLKAIDAVGIRALLDKIDQKEATIQHLEKRVNEVLERIRPAPAPLQTVGTYKHSVNGGKCKVDFIEGNQFRFTSEENKTCIGEWDPVNRTFKTEWGTIFYFNTTGLLVFDSASMWVK